MSQAIAVRWEEALFEIDDRPRHLLKRGLLDYYGGNQEYGLRIAFVWNQGSSIARFVNIAHQHLQPQKTSAATSHNAATGLAACFQHGLWLKNYKYNIIFRRRIQDSFSARYRDARRVRLL